MFRLSLPLLALAEAPYQGLPETLPADIIESSGFVDFERLPGGVRAPLGFEFFLDGRSVPPTDAAALAEVFSEKLYARLPPKSHIVSSRDEQGREVWNYPQGTSVAHVIRLADAASSLFELRIVEKQPNGQWAYGVYFPSAQSPDILALEKEDSVQPVRFAVEKPQGEKIEVSMRRITIYSCRNCHFVNSASRHQYHNAALAGPCHFVPGNAAAVKDWIQKYQARHGESPVELSPFRGLR